MNLPINFLTAFIAVPFIIGMAGDVAKKLILGGGKMPPNGYRGWRGVYYVTYRWHALLVGACLGVVAFYTGMPSLFGDKIGAYVLGYTFSGGVAMVGYALTVKTIQAVIKNAAKDIGVDDQELK